MSHRSSIILLLLLALVFYRVWASGKLGRAWAAIQTGGGSSTAPPSTVGGALGGASTGAGGSYASGFGVNAPFSGYGTSVPGVASADQAGLNAYGGSHPLAGDFDYGASLGTPVYLPGGSGASYTFLGNSPNLGQWGNLLSFSTPGGGIINLPHLAALGSLTPGQSYTGGTYVGEVGNPQGTTAPSGATAYWTAPHLAIIIDQAAQNFLASIGLTQ